MSCFHSSGTLGLAEKDALNGVNGVTMKKSVAGLFKKVEQLNLS